jgi:predicted dehydrogenase
MSANSLNRRHFLKMTGTAAVVAGTVTSPAVVRARNSNDKLRIGFIGPGGRGFGAHVKTLARLHNEGRPVELVAVADVFSEHRDRTAEYVKEENGNDVTTFVDYREMIEQCDLDAVCIGTPDHWHCKQACDAMKAGLHVYCEKPMTKKVSEAMEVVRCWQQTGRIMQVGVQSTSLPLWAKVNELLRDGKLGKVLMYQTEFFRNSIMGQWRYYKLKDSMTPSNIDWKTWLGVEDGLAEEMPFDRAVYAQWRRFWPFGSGMFTDLFVHRTTSMMKATGLRYPGRVTGAGGIFLEYDGRQVPDVATVVADFKEGVQGLVTATMCCQNTPIRQLIRGHFGSFSFGNGEQFEGFDYIPERPQVTLDSKLKEERIEVGPAPKTTKLHFENWVDAMLAGDQQKCNNPPDLGAAAIATVILGAMSYRYGKVYHFNADTLEYSDGDESWAQGWEQLSAERAKPRHIPGWTAGDYGSLLEDPEYQRLEGPWVGGNDPAK